MKKTSLTAEYYEQLDNIALGKAYNNDAEFFYKKVCRWYSKECSTPLTEVFKLDWDHVISTYYESMYDNLPKAEIAQLAKERFTPDLIEAEEQSNEEFAKNFERAYLAKVNKTESLDKPEPEETGISLKFEDNEELE